MKISTGNKDFDDWLEGGYETDIITTLYGPAGSGKTNLCLLSAVEQAKKGMKVIFIDTEGSFSIERLKQLADESVMKNILLLKATKFYEQVQIFNKLLGKINKDIGLIIVDSMVMLYRLEVGIAREENEEEKVRILNMAMAKQLRILNEIARKKNIPVIITDQVYSDFLNSERIQEMREKGIDINEEKSKNVKMVGGDLLKYWSKCIIELKRDGNKRKAILKKHRSLPEKEFSFQITAKGIEKVGFKLF
ncbi:MAG: DNA repair and recombination protein RadB [Candidatus Pacearchaeota archaeon]